MDITIIEYKRPNAEIKKITISINNDLQRKFELIEKCGCELTSEPWGNDVTLTIAHPETGDFDIDIIAVKQGSAVRKFEEMIENFDLESFIKWKERIDGKEDIALSQLMQNEPEGKRLIEAE